MIDESHLKQLLRFHDRIQFRFIITNYSIVVSRMTVFWTALFPIFPTSTKIKRRHQEEERYLWLGFMTK